MRKCGESKRKPLTEAQRQERGRLVMREFAARQQHEYQTEKLNY